MKKFLLLFFITLSVSAFAQNQKSSSIVTIGGVGYYVHTVVRGETVYSLSKLYNISPEDLIAQNPQAVDGLGVDQVLKLSVAKPELSRKDEKKEAKKFDEHIVNSGETAYSISKRYEISVNTLLEDNPGLDPTVISIGQRLKIRKTSVGNTDSHQITQQWKAYSEAATSVSDDYIFHLVKQGETLYSLSNMYDVTQEQIRELNPLDEGLKAGSMIRIPKKAKIKTIITPPEYPIMIGPAVDPEDRTVKLRRKSDVLKIAMFLPLKTDTESNQNYLDFYQGALMALKELKAGGYNVEFNLYNSKKSREEVQKIVAEDSFSGTDLIIGPVYDESLAPVIKFASTARVPVVSPLANVESVDNPFLFQLAPDNDQHYAKIKEIVSGDKNVIVISTADNNDTEFEKAIIPILPTGYKSINYSKSLTISTIGSYFSSTKDNIIVVVSSDELLIEEFMARISSMQNNLQSRYGKAKEIMIIGTPAWKRFRIAVDRERLFKLGFCYTVSYYAERHDSKVAAFDVSYFQSFKSLPTNYTYRGYDAVKMFTVALTANSPSFIDALNKSGEDLLQVKYRFSQKTSESNYINQQWPLIMYRPDYTIEIR